MSGEDRELWCDKPAWRSTRTSLELFGIVAGVIGVALVLAEIWQMNRLSQIDKALHFVERFAEPDMLEHQARIAAVAEEINASLRAAGEGVGLLPEENARVMEYYFLTEDALARDRLNSLLRLVRFFEEVAICELQGLCDHDTICQFFTSPAEALQRDFGHAYTVHAERNGLGDIRLGVQRLGSLECADLFETPSRSR